MSLVALLISALSAAPPPQAAPVSAPQVRPYAAVATELYAPPVVRPYEPPSNFGRQIAEGDADATVRTRPIAAPVAVEAYSDTYETRRSPRELSYQQGVETARISQNARMGTLDGLWRAVDAEGRPVLDLVLSDRGPTWPVEGALRLLGEDRTAPIDSVATEGEARVLTASVDGHALALRLHRRDEGWSADLTGVGRRQTLSLVRPEGWAP